MSSLKDFDRMIIQMMGDFGGTGTFIINTKGPSDPVTGDVNITPAEYDVQAILLDLTLQSNGLQSIENTLIQFGDKRCYVRPYNKSNPEQVMPFPQPNKDKFRMGGVTYKIVTLKQANPSAIDNVLFELYLRA